MPTGFSVQGDGQLRLCRGKLSQAVRSLPEDRAKSGNVPSLGLSQRRWATGSAKHSLISFDQAT